MAIAPFKISIPESMLIDMKRRLSETRWPDEIENSGWQYGTNLSYIKTLVRHWESEFDWRKQEDYINSFANFRTDSQNVNIHFIHERGKGPDPIPLIITHGWPSTFVEFLKIIPMLVDPASNGGDPKDSFDVVVPSLPGYGFSDKPLIAGMTNREISSIWSNLMTDHLGYKKYGAHGDDWGASISAHLGFSYPEELFGIHITSVGTVTPYLGPQSKRLSPNERYLLKATEEWMKSEGGYTHIQGTKPQSLSYGLNDSPAALAAWIVEKFRSWSDCDGELDKSFTKDQLLTNITIYWVTQTINSSMRAYYEFLKNPWKLNIDQRIDVPCGIAVFPKEPVPLLREWTERSFNIQRWTEMPRGGHFPALEEPDLLVEDLRDFFRPFRG